MTDDKGNGFEIIEAIKNGDTQSIELNKDLDEQSKRRIQTITEENAERLDLNHKNEIIRLTKTKVEYERIMEMKEKEIIPEEAVKTDFSSILGSVLNRCKRPPVTILSDADPIFTDYLPLYGGTYTIIGAYSNAGKTTFATKLVIDMISHFNGTKKVLLLTPETDEIDTVITLLSRIAGFKIVDAIRNGNVTDQQLNAAISKLQDRVEIVDLNKADIQHVNSFIKLVENRLATGEYGAVILDYIQCVSVSDNMSDSIGTRAIGKASNAFQAWARKYENISFVAFAQLKKASSELTAFKERTEKNHQDLYNKADWCLELIRAPNYESHFIVRKVRNSDIPLNARIKLGFDITRFKYVHIEDPQWLSAREEWKEKYSDIAEEGEQSGSSSVAFSDVAKKILSGEY